MKRYILSYSGGKDSTALFYIITRKNLPLDEVVFFDTGAEYDSTYDEIQKIKNKCETKDIKFTVLKSKYNLISQIMYYRKWCGEIDRFYTHEKLRVIDKYCGDHYQYVGIAADESHRGRKTESRIYPLVEHGITEKECLAISYNNGHEWREKNGVCLYNCLDRCSCWCCKNKNSSELKAYVKFLPHYIERIKVLELGIGAYFKYGKSIDELVKYYQSKG